MLKSCSYCSKIHPKSYDCGKKPKPYGHKHSTAKDKYRWTMAWQNKRAEIKDRDKGMCQVCIRRLHDYGARQYNFEGIQVHHIDSLQDNFDRRADNDNLITICSHHHEQAERGTIPKRVLFDIVSEQEYPPVSM